MSPSTSVETADQKIRRLASSTRFRKSWALLDVREGPHREHGLNAVIRMLDAEGVSFVDLLETLAPERPKTAPASAFADIFSHMMGGLDGQRQQTRPKAQAPCPEARRKPSAPSRILQGAQIPVRISGTVVVSDERPTSRGRMLVFGVLGEDATYQPIVAFPEAIIERLKAAAESGERVTVQVSPPRSVREMPRAIGIS